MESCAQVEFPLLQGSYSQATHSSLPHLSPLSSLLLVFCRSLSLSVFLSLSLSLSLVISTLVPLFSLAPCNTNPNFEVSVQNMAPSWHPSHWKYHMIWWPALQLSQLYPYSAVQRFRKKPSRGSREGEGRRQA